MSKIEGSKEEEITGMPLTLPTLRVGALPLPATQGEGKMQEQTTDAIPFTA
jgi:hypothetical protein